MRIELIWWNITFKIWTEKIKNYCWKYQPLKTLHHFNIVGKEVIEIFFFYNSKLLLLPFVEVNFCIEKKQITQKYLNGFLQKWKIRKVDEHMRDKWLINRKEWYSEEKDLRNWKAFSDNEYKWLIQNYVKGNINVNMI